MKGIAWTGLALLMAITSAAESQIIRSSARVRPMAWTSLSVGWFQQGRVCGSRDGTCWDFGGAPQFRGTLELPLGESASFGAAATVARVPLIYDGALVAPNSCSGCDADANVTQYLATLRLGGGGSGFHQVIDVSAGTTIYTNFRSTAGTKLGAGAVNDMTFGVGYGFGYNLSQRAQIMLVQEWALVLHERQSGRSENTTTQRNVRIGGRFALGDRR